MFGNRIIGGQSAPSSIPWQVSIRLGSGGNGHFCGGAILDHKTIVTAAHCFNKGESTSGYYIMAGSSQIYATIGNRQVKCFSKNRHCFFYFAQIKTFFFLS